ncbi:hypothetical protein ES695_14385 [Candidatus Atribacteria bacterium 1244-E10-H5-B2]|nr:MAG: hypothetical protein ES695_14385 [Candidatus Atribacteria bacterium 1244-E10-H5-B2]
MVPERIKFLDRFDNFYQVMVNSVKEDKINERDFYALVIAKAKTMEKERRERIEIKVEYTNSFVK